MSANLKEDILDSVTGTCLGIIDGTHVVCTPNEWLECHIHIVVALSRNLEAMRLMLKKAQLPNDRFKAAMLEGISAARMYATSNTEEPRARDVDAIFADLMKGIKR